MLGFAFILKTFKKLHELELDLKFLEWSPLNIILLYLFIGTASLGFLAKRAFGKKTEEQGKRAEEFLPNGMEDMIGKILIEDALKELMLDVESVSCNILKEKSKNEDRLKLQILNCKLQSNIDIIMITADISCSILFNTTENKIHLKATSMNTFSFDCQDPKSSIISDIQTSLSKINSEITLSSEFPSNHRTKKRVKAFYLVLSRVQFPDFPKTGLEITVGKTKLGPYFENQLQNSQVFKFEKLEKNFCELNFPGWKSFKMPIETGKEEFLDETKAFHFQVEKFLVIGEEEIRKFEESL